MKSKAMTILCTAALLIAAAAYGNGDERDKINPDNRSLCGQTPKNLTDT